MIHAKCSVCATKDAKIILQPHWKTGEMRPFTLGTCGSPECEESYNHLLIEADMLVKASFEAYANEMDQKEILS